MPEKIGVIGHYFNRVGVATVKLEAPLKKGDAIQVKGHTTDFTCTIASLQIDRKDVEEAGPGDEVGFQVPEKVRTGDIVYRA